MRTTLAAVMKARLSNYALIGGAVMTGEVFSRVYRHHESPMDVGSFLSILAGVSVVFFADSLWAWYRQSRSSPETS